jgi:hypothetical protein
VALDLTQIPKIMRAQRWTNAALLMDKWFSRPAATKPRYSEPPDTTTVTMGGWALMFPRAKSVYDQLIRDRIWANRPAQKAVADLLRRKGLVGKGGASFGIPPGTPSRFHDDHVNHREVGFGLADLDEMTAALGNFSFYVVVAGSVEPVPKGAGHKVTIKQVGVYLKDSYDFNGEQFLGFWNDEKNTVSMIKVWSGTGVGNADFRAWRQRTGMGGDFLTFSDVKLTTLDRPDEFTI